MCRDILRKIKVPAVDQMCRFKIAAFTFHITNLFMTKVFLCYTKKELSKSKNA